MSAMRILQHLSMVPGAIFQTLLYGYGEPESQTRITADTRWWLAEQQRGDGELAPFDAERYLGALLSATRVDVERLTAELAQRTRERDAARRGIKGLSEHLVAGHATLGKANAEIMRLRAAVVRLTTERDARDDDVLKWTGIAGDQAEEIERLRALTAAVEAPGGGA
jgi:chromosome segregation ATPase